MANNFIQDGDVLDIVVSATTTSGTPVLRGTRLTIPLKSGVSGDTIAHAVEGVFEITKATGAGTGLTVGAIAYWDDTAKKVTGSASGNTAIGWAVEDAGTAVATAKVKLYC
jgi:hypothetical protein